MLMFKIIDSTEDDFDTADIDDGDDVNKTSIDNRYDFDIADIDNGNDDDKNSVDKREDIVEGVEHNGGNSTSKKPTCGDTICFFLWFSTLTYHHCLFERGFVDLCHGCNYVNRYFYQKISTASKITPA